MAISEEEKVNLVLQEAERIENTDPKRASIIYLDASEFYIHISRTHPYEAQNYINKATWCYQKFQDINPSNARKENADIEIRNLSNNEKFSSGILFKDIGGLESLKEEIRLKVIEPMKYPDIFRKYGKNIGGGILMYGPPGCGKSLIAEATANEANAAFFHVKASDLKSKYVGETEQNIARLFKEAREKQPSIIFFDEFEVLGGERNQSDPYTRQAVSQLLTEMDGVGTKDQQILLLAATNEPWNIDIALKREGRFGQSIFIPPPDYESRKKIFEMNLKDKPLDNIKFHEVAQCTENFSGADIKAVCNKATEYPLLDFIRSKNLRRINSTDIENAIIQHKSTTIPWFRNAYKLIFERRMEDLYPELIEIGKNMEEISVVVRKK